MVETLSVYSRLTTHRPPDSQFTLTKPLKQALTNLNDNIKSTSAIIEIRGNWPKYTGCEEQWLMYFSYVIHIALLYQKNDVEHIPNITIQCIQVEKMLRISIEDNGIGVKENLLDIITIPFKRMQSDKDFPGIGMGLSYCEHIAELHGGELKIGLSSQGGLAVIYAEKLLRKSCLN